MFYKHEDHGHGKYVATGVALGFGLAVGVYYAVQYKVHQKAQALVADLARKGLVTYNNFTQKETVPPVEKNA